jgi:hypothetical protein
MGRPPKFCSRACRQAAYLARNVRRPRPVELLAADLAHMKLQDWLRHEMRTILEQEGLLRAPAPPAIPRPRNPKPNLKLVKSDSKAD